MKPDKNAIQSADFSCKAVGDLFTELQSSELGLSNELAQNRMSELDKYMRRQSSLGKDLQLLLRQFTSPLVVLLVVAVILSAILGESSDSIIILVILLITGLLGFWQELNAGHAIEKLRAMIETKHNVVREGTITQLPTEKIVPGDVLQLKAGDMIPADCRLIECNELHVNESALTGESFPSEKSSVTLDKPVPVNKRYNCLWRGTNVVSGMATALVVNTGAQTVFGKIEASLLQTPETAFQKGIKHFGYFLLKITLLLSLIILVINLYFKKPFFDSLLFSLALSVGMAPELLPAIMTFAMSAGAKQMLKKKVIVKKLSSIFNLGEVSILCTDKTGTITEGNVKVSAIIDIDGDNSKKLELYASLNAALQQGFENPIDQAIVALNIPLNGFEKINEVPYDFIRKRLTVAVTNGIETFAVTKGAFASVAAVCSQIEKADGHRAVVDDSALKHMECVFKKYVKQGYRVLGLCYKQQTIQKVTKDDEKEMVFLGYILLEDPLKESAKASINRLRNLNVDVKIITGDNRYAAYGAADLIGLASTGILTGADISNLYPEALAVKVKETAIFAEIDPQQKEMIIKALQKTGAAVAYIGDGINDVAAINAADVGLSTNNAVDIAKEAADFVLLEKDLSVLADGIYEGRKSFINSMKYIFITTGATFGNMFSVAGASLFLPFLPMLPKQILMTNLLTDFPFLTIASDHVENGQLQKPEKWNLKLIRNFMIVFGLHSSIFDFITFYTLWSYFKLIETPFQTGWFLESVTTELLIIFVIRTRTSMLKDKPGSLLMVTAIIAICTTFWLPFSPFAKSLGLAIAHTKQIIFIIIILMLYVITADILKLFFFKFSSSQEKR